MRNGIYRVWMNGPESKSGGAIALKDGDLIAVNPSFGFYGHYHVSRGRFIAEMTCRRLCTEVPPVNLPDLEELHLSLEGPANREFTTAIGTIAEVPGFSMPFELAWLCEA